MAQISIVSEDVQSGDRTLLTSADYELNFDAAAITLANGLVGLLPPPYNVIGSTFIALFWQHSIDNVAEHEKKIYEAVQNIVHKELEDHDLKMASDKLSGFVSFLKTEYEPLKKKFKEGIKTKEDLFKALTPYDQTFHEDIVTVFRHTSQEYELAAVALANFILGANHHMALNQERALVDPDEKEDNPSKSAYADKVSNLAKDYAAYARKTAPYVKQIRLAQISEIKRIAVSMSDSFHPRFGFYFIDSNTNYESEIYQKSENAYEEVQDIADAQTARTAYYNKISSQMDKTLWYQVESVAISWDQLVYDPIPKNARPWVGLPHGPALSDASGFGNPQYYKTIQCADIDGDGRAELIGKDAYGIFCFKFNEAGQWVELPRGPAWSDASGFGNPQYYETIQCADIDGDGRAELIVRGATGIGCFKFNQAGQWVGLPHGPAWSDAGGFGNPQYYKTIQCADIDGDGRAELIVRGAYDIFCFKFNEAGRWVKLPHGPAWSDASGFDNPQYYETIQCADIDRDGRAELIVRGAYGIGCFKLA